MNILFQEQTWRIYDTVDLYNYGPLNAVISHTCSGEPLDWFRYLDSEDSFIGECWWCKEKMPESIIALWKLLNWDVLPDLPRFEENDWARELSPVITD